MAIEELLDNQSDSYWASLDSPYGKSLPSTWTYGRTAHLGSNDSAGNVYTVADLPAAPAGFQWASQGLGNFALISDDVATDPTGAYAATQAYGPYGPMGGPGSPQAMERAKWAAIAQERAKPITDINIINSLNTSEWYQNQKTDAKLKVQEDLANGLITPEEAYQRTNDIMMTFGEDKGTPGKGGDTGYTGANIAAGQAAQGAAYNAATTASNQQAMQQAAQAAASLAQPGYGIGETARNEARNAAQATTSPYTISDAYAKAASEGRETAGADNLAEGLPNTPLTTPEPTLADKLGSALKSTPVVGKAIGAYDTVKDLAGSLASTLRENATPTTSTPSTSARTDTTAMPTPYSSPTSSVQGKIMDKTNTPLAPTASTTPSVPKGPYKATLAPALTAKLRNEGLNRNIEYGYNKLATPTSARSNYARPGRGMAGMS